MITDKEGMEWLRGRLERVDVATFKNTELYRLLKKRLSKIGYWKRLPRGNPKKGYQAMIEKANTN